MPLDLAELLSGEAEVQVMGKKKKSTRLSSNSKVNFTFCIMKTSLQPIALVGKVIYEKLYPLRTTYALHVHVHVLSIHVHACTSGGGQ